jgi:sulfur transfer protein SufE/stress-induced morphogen
MAATFLIKLLLAASVCIACSGFLTAAPCSAFRGFALAQQSMTAPSLSRMAMTTASDIKTLGLTPELERLVKAFRSMPDDKMRYKQLLFMASQGKELPAALKTPENKVQGCLSTVHVSASVKNDKVYFEGDSDAQLTMGLLSVLMRGLSGNSAEAIQQVKPEFIQLAGLQASLTPGRNNGFLNMLATMKRKALEATQSAPAEAAAAPAASEPVAAVADGEEIAEVPGKPVTTAMLRKLNALQPVRLQVEDESGDEQKFYIAVVSSAFEGMSLLKRHQLVHLTIADEMKLVHAVQLSTKTPAEMGL